MCALCCFTKVQWTRAHRFPNASQVHWGVIIRRSMEQSWKQEDLKTCMLLQNG